MGKRVLLSVATAGLCGSLYAFEPLLFVKEIKGASSITPPGATTAQPLSGARAYPYGSKIATGAGAEVRVAISERNFLILGADTTVVLQKGTAEEAETHRVVQVEKGSVTAQLEDDFDKKGTKRVTLQSPGGIGEPAIGGEYSVTVAPEADLWEADYLTLRGEMKLYDNALFAIPALRHDHRVSLGISADKGFVRLIDRKGSFPVELKNVQNADGTPKTLEMKSDMMLKMWRKQSDVGGVWVVTTLFINAKGGLDESLSYNVKPM